MERIHVTQLRARLSQLGAEFLPRESALFNGRAHVYFIRSRSTYIKVTRQSETVKLEYSATCPCHKAG